nr:unnamed protein product [Callosobruchus chinensis]
MNKFQEGRRPISVVELECRRLAMAASLSMDLKTTTARGCKNMVAFNAFKTQYCTLSNKRKYFSPSNLLTLYKAQIKPSLEYCSHIWGAGALTTLSILDAVQRRAIRLIGDPALTCHLQPLSHRCAVDDLSLFHRHSNGFCSSELASIIPPLFKPARFAGLLHLTPRPSKTMFIIELSALAEVNIVSKKEESEPNIRSSSDSFAGFGQTR